MWWQYIFPVTTATSERSFSTLRRLKTYLRNTMSENQLNGLALLNIHRDINVSAEKILDMFTIMTRRLDL
ncbi:zinc finger MYM-type protein 1-like [Arctopsyche grandis]|uniref:zinc finger MYM-type protein 1-like n=1 Tax=Arctopsyche grandis TaxID=121162 RepID=UPI00406D74C3